MPALRPVALIAVVLLIAAGCGGDDDSGTPESSESTAAETSPSAEDGRSDGTASACPAEADVSTAVGTDVTGDPPVPDRCGYYSADGSVSVGIDIEDPTTRTLADIERSQPVDPVTGLGESAYSIETPGGIVQLGVFADGSHVLVTVQGVGGASVDAARAVYDLYVGS